MISRLPLPNCRSGVIGLAIAGNPENDGHLSPWQEAVGHEIIPDTHKNGCANEATTGLTRGLFVMLFQDVAFGGRRGAVAARHPAMARRALRAGRPACREPSCRHEHGQLVTAKPAV
jgi:hypothetical protein